ncbi:conserved protein of unknown function [Candidatus Hydrogenisulfobacillus filiaventi]|uniref:Uncharacterized protein n=1 Tax=Candidatus Hydrogenisulfobacillus filiaventi TaxID=2707344 RepID=A0A6F8ZCG8_9FIRM|nr:conserved protein of unknown function [Candidatus Hydrogenisulfobacillus filiaventi]
MADTDPLLAAAGLAVTAERRRRLARFAWDRLPVPPEAGLIRLAAEEEVWVTARHAAELTHVSPEVIRSLWQTGALPWLPAPNPHDPGFAPMRLLPLSRLQAYLDAHPGLRHARPARAAGDSRRLRAVTARLERLADPRPLAALWLLLLGWEADPPQLAAAKRRVLPLLWETTPTAEREAWRAPDAAGGIRLQFPGIGEARFRSPWLPDGAPAANRAAPDDGGRFFGRAVGQREPARYPPALVEERLEAVLPRLVPRWF